MVPRTPNGLAVDQAFGERSTIVCARRANRDEIVSDPREKHGLAIRMSKEFAARLKCRCVDALPEIRSRELRLTTHVRLVWFAVVQFKSRVRSTLINFARPSIVQKL